MQVLRLVSFVAAAAAMVAANEAATQEKRLIPGGASPLDQVTQVLPIKRLLPGGSNPVDEVTGILPVKRLSTESLPISALTSSLSGVTAVKRVVEELVAQEKRLSTDSLPVADGLSGILGGGLPLKRQVDLLNELGGLAGAASSSSTPTARDEEKRQTEVLEGILGGGLPTKRQMEILNSAGGLLGLSNLPAKRQLDLIKGMAGRESQDQSEFKRQLGLLQGLVPGGETLPIKRSEHHNKRTELALRALPGADAITGLLSTGSESQKRLLDSLASLPGADTVTSLASGGLPTRRQMDLLTAVGGIGGLAKQNAKRQVEFLNALAGSTDGLATREDLNEEAMKFVYRSLLDERSNDGRGKRPVSRDTSSTGDCSVGKAQCCDQVINDKSKKETLAGLAGLDDVVGSIALNCNQLPIGILPIAAQNTCKSSPVCCNSVSQNGLVNFGCISLPIN